MRHQIFSAGIVFTLMPIAMAQDTEATRAKAADRYFKVVPVKEMMSDLLDQSKSAQSSEEQAWLKKIFDQYIDYVELEKVMKASMGKIFTTEEINALIAFHSTPVGRSSVKKLGSYMVEILPGMKAEMMRAIAKAQSEVDSAH